MRAETAEVLWCYLAHEYQRRLRYLPGTELGLSQPMWPGVRAQRLVRAVKEAQKAGRANKGVLWVTKLIADRRWNRRLVSWRFLGECKSILHNSRWRSLSTLAPMWQAQLSKKEKHDHKVLVREIRTGRIPWPIICAKTSVGLTIIDGRHRAFAMFEARCQALTVFTGKK